MKEDDESYRKCGGEVDEYQKGHTRDEGGNDGSVEKQREESGKEKRRGGGIKK